MAVRVQDLQAELESEVTKQGYSHFIIRAAFFTSRDKKNYLHYCRIDFSNSPDRPKDEILDYGDVKIVRRVQDIANLRIVTSSILGGSLDTGAELINRQASGLQNDNWHYVPSGRPWGHFEFDNAVKIADLGTSSGQIPYIPLPARPGLPFFQTIVKAITGYMELSQDIHSPGFDIICPETRGSIKEVVIIGTELSLIASDLMHNTKYIGKFMCRKGRIQRLASPDIDLDGNKAVFDCGFEPDEADIALVHLDSGEMLDSKEFRGLTGAQSGIRIETPQHFVRDLIESGESKTVEFKVGMQEKDQVIQTIDGFLNTEGGTIIIGVTDRKEVKGFYDDEERTKRTIQGLLRSFIDPAADVSLKWVNLDGKPLLLIQVPTGKNKPYVMDGKGILIREGDGEYQASRAQIDAMYEGRPPRI